MADVRARGGEGELTAFKESVGSTSQAVMARPLGEVERLAASDSELYTTFYQREAAGIRLPDGDEWRLPRVTTDEAFFPGYKQEIAFAALSLDGTGLLGNYGDCWLVLKDKMIAHRASVFDENTAAFTKNHDLKTSELADLPRGHRATWAERGKLAAIKTAPEVQAGTRPEDFAGLLLRRGATADDDVFLEVHVYGTITVRAFERVVMAGADGRRSKRAMLKALGERLARYGVPLG